LEGDVKVNLRIIAIPHKYLSKINLTFGLSRK
jgi:hypothetical protein